MTQDNIISDFRVSLRFNMSVDILIVSDKITSKEIQEKLGNKGPTLEIEVISLNEASNDSFYSDFLKKSNKVSLGVRQGLSSIIEKPEIRNYKKNSRIVTFYSYKGGVGRTTALALFASYLSIHQEKKVFVIDCDFEAPGLINFFNVSSESTPKSGVVEYFKDKEAGFKINLEDYLYEVSNEYCGDGKIWLMPSGNVFAASDRNCYLEGLGRIDIRDSLHFENQFKEMISIIEETFKPDIICIDSRTGFNDLIGILGNYISDVVVGFFGNNVQNKPGLHFLIERMLESNTKNLFLVLSIISSSFTQEIAKFNDEIESVVLFNDDEKTEGLPSFPTHYLQRYSSLEKLGSWNEDLGDFVTLIKEKHLPEYFQLFEKIYNQLFPSKFDDRIEKFGFDEADGNNSDIIENAPFSYQQTNNTNHSSIKRILLEPLLKKYPEIYAENIVYSEEYLAKIFYFRMCMEDIFIKEKFILLGGKGTGKTAFYRALSDRTFFTKLQERSQKSSRKTKILSMVNPPDQVAKEREVRFFKIADQFKPDQYSKISDFFFRRFWLAYIWSALREEVSKMDTNINLSLPYFPIENNQKTADFFLKIIDDNELLKKIETEIEIIDKYLNSVETDFLLTFDYLDQIIKPIEWDKGISPLIQLCQSKPYKRINPKLFLRRDLYDKLSNLTNKNMLEQRTINLEWSIDELYAFFLKLVFSTTENSFFEYSKKYLDHDFIDSARKKMEKKNSLSQLPAEEFYLKPFINIFFGLPQNQQRNGSTAYEWIYANLKNADKTISLRPFLDLVRLAIENGMQNCNALDSDDYPILSTLCINYEVRRAAVENHFKDLAKEEGNEVLSQIISDIRDDKVSNSFKILSMSQRDFEELMLSIKRRHQFLSEVGLEEMIATLLSNGIVFVKFIPGGRKWFSFAYLYKYFLGLRSRKNMGIKFN